MNERRIITLDRNLTGFSSAGKPSSAHHKIMKRLCSPFMGGPKPSDDLMDFVMHLYNEEEADLVQHLPVFIPRTAKSIARRSGRSVEDVSRVLDDLALTKRVLIYFGNPRRYCIVPIVIGLFETVLITPDMSRLNDWHREFAEKFRRLFNTGFTGNHKWPAVNYLPVNYATQSMQTTLPYCKLEEFLDPYDDFAVANCQCRISTQLQGEGCDKPMEACVFAGKMSRFAMDRGMARKADREEIIEIKHNAEREGCVSFTIPTIDPLVGNASCSCCSCCCHAFRNITEFSTPAWVCKPLFLPVYSYDKCTGCQKCVRICPTQAWSSAGKKQKPEFDDARCIGCGLCVSSCEFEALSLTSVRELTDADFSLSKYLLNFIPEYISGSLSLFSKRLFSR